jgi:hypothetical protein
VLKTVSAHPMRMALLQRWGSQMQSLTASRGGATRWEPGTLLLTTQAVARARSVPCWRSAPTNLNDVASPGAARPTCMGYSCRGNTPRAIQLYIVALENYDMQPYSTTRAHKAANAASKFLTFFLCIIKFGVFACFFRAKSAVLAVVASFAGQYESQRPYWDACCP